MISTEMINMFTYDLQRDINEYNTEMTTRRSQLNMPGVFFSERCRSLPYMIESVNEHTNVNAWSRIHRKNEATSTRPTNLLKHLKKDHFNINQWTNSLDTCL